MSMTRRTASTAYWHGGPDGLMPGDVLLPRSLTRAPSALAYFEAEFGRQPEQAYQCDRADRVYLFAADRRTEAAHFAYWRHFDRGRIYLVRPIGPVAPDAGFLVAGWAFSCARARILEVHTIDPFEAQRAQALYDLQVRAAQEHALRVRR